MEYVAWGAYRRTASGPLTRSRLKLPADTVSSRPCSRKDGCIAKLKECTKRRRRGQCGIGIGDRGLQNCPPLRSDRGPLLRNMLCVEFRSEEHTSELQSLR